MHTLHAISSNVFERIVLIVPIGLNFKLHVCTCISGRSDHYSVTCKAGTEYHPRALEFIPSF